MYTSLLFEGNSTDGGWSNWSGWWPCSESCMGGITVRFRHCDNPLPSGGGANCTGHEMEQSNCNTHSCPGNQNGYFLVFFKFFIEFRKRKISDNIIVLQYLITLPRNVIQCHQDERRGASCIRSELRRTSEFTFIIFCNWKSRPGTLQAHADWNEQRNVTWIESAKWWQLRQNLPPIVCVGTRLKGQTDGRNERRTIFSTFFGLFCFFFLSVVQVIYNMCQCYC